jgi:hypothetical protein
MVSDNRRVIMAVTALIAVGAEFARLVQVMPNDDLRLSLFDVPESPHTLHPDARAFSDK